MAVFAQLYAVHRLTTEPSSPAPQMYISRFEIRNYKSFFRSNPLELKPGFNVITGQNNAGKTAFLEGLSLRFTADPHRSLRTMPTAGERPDPVSSVDIRFEISRSELLQMLGVQEAEYYIAAPLSGTQGYGGDTGESRQAFVDRLLARESYTFRLRLERGVGVRDLWVAPEFPSFGLYQARPPNQPGMRLFIRIRFDRGRFTIVGDIVGMDERNEIGFAVASLVSDRIYRFTAERFKVAVRGTGASAALNSDASNLPEVLGVLQGRNPRRFAQLNALLRKIFPQVFEISVRLISAQQLEIIVWTIDPALQREDLAISLEQSGTGIGQVLAIL